MNQEWTKQIEDCKQRISEIRDEILEARMAERNATTILEPSRSPLINLGRLHSVLRRAEDMLSTAIDVTKGDE